MCVSSTMLEAGGKILQGVSDSNTAKTNARYAEMEGRSALNAAATEYGQIKGAGVRHGGQIAVSQAKGGADLSSGSAALVAAENEKNYELDALQAIQRGRLTNWAKKGEAKLLKRQAKASMWNAGIGAGATILGGIEKAAMAGAGGG
jgi:hypothetical protein